MESGLDILDFVQMLRQNQMPEFEGQSEQEAIQTMLDGMELNKLGRYEFYDACCQPGVRLAISTGEQRIFSNLLITIGVA